MARVPSGAAALLLGLLPAGAAKNRLLSLLPGWEVAPSAVVRPSVFWQLTTVRIAAGAAVGTGNVFRGPVSLDLGTDAILGQFNWVTTASGLPGEHPRSLRLDEHSALTSRHYLDVVGGLSVGHHSIVAGVRTTVFTHQTDRVSGSVSTGAVRIGAYALVSSNVFVAPGVTVDDYVVVGGGAIVARDLAGPYRLYAGNPAVSVRELDPGDAYFRREKGFIEPV